MPFNRWFKNVSKYWTKAHYRAQLRRSFYKGIVWVLVVGMSISFGLVNFLTRSQHKQQNTVAHVDGASIGAWPYHRRTSAKRESLAMMQRQFSQFGVPFDLNEDPQKWAMETLINDVLLDAVAGDLRLNLDEDYIAYKLMDPYFAFEELSEFIPIHVLLSQSFDAMTISQALQQKGISYREFELFIEKALARRCVKDIVRNAFYVPAFSLRHEYQTQYAPRDYTLLELSLDSYVQHEKETQLEDKDITAFFEQQNMTTKRYDVPERRSGKMWEFKAQDYKVMVSDADLRDYYENHKSKFIDAPAKVNVRRILIKQDDGAQQKTQDLYDQLIKDPDSFAKKAKGVSEDPETSKKGGETGYFVKKDKSKVFGTAAFRLKQPGDISPVIQTDDGYEILQLIERTKMTYKSFDSVKSSLHAQVVDRKFKLSFSDDIEELLTKVLGNKDSIEQFVKNHGGKERTLDEVTRDSSVRAERLFKIRGKDFAYFKEGDLGILIQLTDIHPSYTPELVSVRETVVEDLYRDKATKALKRDLKLALKDVSSSSMGELAKKYNGILRKVVKVVASDDKRKEKLGKDNMPVDTMLMLEVPGKATTVFEGLTGYLVHLDSMTAFDKDDFDQHRQELSLQLLQKYGALELESFIVGLRRAATITLNEKALDNR
ncbi:peptidylprolyl isomerase [Candidatus Babeliales bacterium]|nr:peptidylprolyl isomerase [Candidatus Babeliales bacterium]